MYGLLKLVLSLVFAVVMVLVGLVVRIVLTAIGLMLHGVAYTIRFLRWIYDGVKQRAA